MAKSVYLEIYNTLSGKQRRIYFQTFAAAKAAYLDGRHDPPAGRVALIACGTTQARKISP